MMAMEPSILSKGTIVQINPATAKNEAFAGCLAVVDEKKPYGCQCYVKNASIEGSLLYYNATYAEIEPVGKAIWLAGFGVD